MSIGNGEWKLWREGEPFNQRFTATISEDGDRIEGRWEYDKGDGWKTDFDLVYTRVSSAAWSPTGSGLLPMVGMRSKCTEVVVEVVGHDDVSRRNDGIDAVQHFAVQANLGPTSWPVSCSVDRGPNTTLAIPGRCIVQAKLRAVSVTPCCSAQSAGAGDGGVGPAG